MGQNCNPQTNISQIQIQCQQKLDVKLPTQEIVLNQQIEKQIKLIRQHNSHFISNINTCHVQNQGQFKGYLKQQSKNGYGQLKIDDQQKYYGYFKDNVPHIKGILILSKSHYYVGQFKNGQMYGNGKQVQQNLIFNGQFQNGMRKYGTLIMPEYVYEGSLKQNKFHLYGQLKFKNGQKYIGQFNHGNYQGYGKLFNQDFLIYEGNFCQNSFNGFGKYYWKNGDKFEGNYKNGIKNGQGVLFINERQVYGIWQNGEMKTKQVVKKL